MNKKNVSMLLGLIFIPVGALLLNACGPQEQMNSELALDEASDNFLVVNGLYSEYGRCNDAWDNDGDGRVDRADPDCETSPIRDLSLASFPIGHNYNPAITNIRPDSAGYMGGFRNRAQITKWFRFLTDSDGYTAGTRALMGPGVNNAVVPIPMPHMPKNIQGTAAQGNNNNSVRQIYETFPTEALVPKAGPASEEFVPTYLKTPWGTQFGPASFYRGGSQGFLVPARTGNPDFSKAK